MAEEQGQNQEPKEESFTGIDPSTLSEEAQKLYKSMQADYTRKTQQLAETRKEFERKESEWQDKFKSYGAVEHEVQQWRDWYANLLATNDQSAEGSSPLGQQPAGAPQAMQGQTKPEGINYLDEPEAKDVSQHLRKLQDTYNGELTKLKSEIQSLHAALKDTTKQTTKMITYQAQLNDLAQKHKGLDKKALLDFALKAGQPDLEKAYMDMNRDSIIEEEVQKRLQEELSRTQGIRGPGQRVLVRPSEGKFKSFAEASEAILREAAGG